MAHIGVNVDEETKKKWGEYIEESDYGSMSELIRTAVRKEIARDSGNDGVPRELEKDLNQVAETQKTLQSQMEGLQEGFEDVSEQAKTGYPSRIVELADDLADELEEVSEEYMVQNRMQFKSELNKLRKKHPDDPSIGEIQDALEYLEENLSYVQTTPKSPDDYYRVRSDL